MIVTTGQACFNLLVDALRRFLGDRTRRAGAREIGRGYLNRCAWWVDYLNVDPCRFLRFLQRPGELLQSRAGRQAGLDGLRDAFSKDVTSAFSYSSTDPRHGTLTYSIAGELLGEIPGFVSAVRAAAKVRLEINSPGGVASPEMLTAIEAHPDTEAHIRHAGSAAALLAIACRRRVIHPEGSILLHSPILAVLGDQQTMLAAASNLGQHTAQDIRFLVRRTGQSRRVCRRWMDGSDWHFDAQAALRAGLVDAIEAPPP